VRDSNPSTSKGRVPKIGELGGSSFITAHREFSWTDIQDSLVRESRWWEYLL
jgi:hypothetical protein